MSQTFLFFEFLMAGRQAGRHNPGPTATLNTHVYTGTGVGQTRSIGPRYCRTVTHHAYTSSHQQGQGIESADRPESSCVMVVLVALIYLNTPPRRRGAVPVGGSRVVSRVFVLGASGGSSSPRVRRRFTSLSHEQHPTVRAPHITEARTWTDRAGLARSSSLTSHGGSALATLSSRFGAEAIVASSHVPRESFHTIEASPSSLVASVTARHSHT